MIKTQNDRIPTTHHPCGDGLANCSLSSAVQDSILAERLQFVTSGGFPSKLESRWNRHRRPRLNTHHTLTFSC
jgi:hypothetical protein